MTRRLWWAGAILAMALTLGMWLGPYALSLYHLEAGGRALDAALVPVSLDRLAPEQMVDAERLETGAAHLHQALRWDPRNAQAMRLLARVYVTQGQSEAALETLQQARDARPDNPLLYLELGDVYDSLGQTEAAIEAYEDGGVGSRGVPLAVNYLKLADAQAQAGGGDVAIELWRKALQVDPGNLYALYRLAQIHRDMGDEEHAAEYEEQLRYFDLNAVAVSPDARLAEYQGRAMAGLVDEGIWERDKLLNVLSYQVWQFAEGVPGVMAERVLDTLLEQRPEDADLLFYLAELYHRRGDLERATAAYKQVLEVDPEYGQAYLRLGMVAEANCEIAGNQRLHANCGELAAEWYERYYEMASDDLSGLKKLTEVYEALERPEAAALQEALEAKTDDQRIVAELLGVPVEKVELGPNLVENGGFEAWVGGMPSGWVWWTMFDRNPYNAAVFAAGGDGLLSFNERAAARVDGFWIQQREDKSPARAGFWQWDELEQALRPITLTTSVPYAFSFDYRTRRVPESGARVWVSDDLDMLWAGYHGLPATDGAWHHFVAVSWNRTGTERAIYPLFSSFAPGSVAYDNAQLRPIELSTEATIATSEARFWVTAGDHQ